MFLRSAVSIVLYREEFLRAEKAYARIASMPSTNLRLLPCDLSRWPEGARPGLLTASRGRRAGAPGPRSSLVLHAYAPSRPRDAPASRPGAQGIDPHLQPDEHHRGHAGASCHGSSSTDQRGDGHLSRAHAKKSRSSGSLTVRCSLPRTIHGSPQAVASPRQERWEGAQHRGSSRRAIAPRPDVVPARRCRRYTEVSRMRYAWLDNRRSHPHERATRGRGRDSPDFH